LDFELARRRSFESAFIITDLGGAILLPTDVNDYIKSIITFKDPETSQVLQEYVEAKISELAHVTFPIFEDPKAYQMALSSFMSVIHTLYESDKDMTYLFQKMDGIFRYLGLIYMSFNKISLDDLLRITLSPRLYEMIKLVKEDVIKIADPRMHRNFPYYAHHDSNHALAVLENAIIKILKGNVPNMVENRYLKLNMLERFLIAVAALVHDIGLALEVPSLDIGIAHREWIELFKTEFKYKLSQNVLKSGKIESYDAIIWYLERSIEEMQRLSKEILLESGKRGVIIGKTEPEKALLDLVRGMHNIISYFMINDIFRKIDQLRIEFVEYGGKGVVLQALARIALGHRDLNIPILSSEKGMIQKGEKIVIDTIKYAKEKAKYKVDIKFFIDFPSAHVDIEVRERYLSTILRLADAMDIERRSRADPRYLYFLDIARNEPNQIEHWAFKLLIDATDLINYNDEYIVEVKYHIPAEILTKYKIKFKARDPILDIKRAIVLTEVNRLMEDVNDVINPLKNTDDDLKIELVTNEKKEPCIILKQMLFYPDEFVKEIICRSEINEIISELAKELGTDKDVEKEIKEKFIQQVGSLILEQIV